MKLSISAAPHIHSGNSSARIMREVGVALLPAVLAGIWFHGLRALAVIAACMLSAMGGEYLLCRLTRRDVQLRDSSAALTGLLLALSLPATVSYPAAILGGLFAAVAVKGLCGGIGRNCFNPALAARVFLLVLFPLQLTRYAAPGVRVPVLGGVDFISSATPLHAMRKPALPQEGLWAMFIGNTGGCIGEISTLALILGGAYLIARRVIRPNIPLSCLGTIALLSLVFSQGQNPVMWMLYNLCGGGAMLGAFFMATDYASAPVTPKGQLLYGAGIGALTVLFRRVGLHPEGFSYAALLMNTASWQLDMFLAPRRFGVRKEAAA